MEIKHGHPGETLLEACASNLSQIFFSVMLDVFQLDKGAYLCHKQSLIMSFHFTELTCCGTFQSKNNSAVKRFGLWLK